MTIDSVAITRQAVLNTSTNTITLPSSSQSGSVNLTLAANPVSSRLVKVGVPLPRGGVGNTSEIVLRDENGAEIQAQYDVLARYGDGSIRSVLVQAVCSPSATVDKNYVLEYGAGVVQATYSTDLALNNNANDYTIDTGRIRVVIDKQTGDFIKEVHLDTAGDNSYATQMITASDVYAQDAIGGDTYQGQYETAPTITVERNGVRNIQIKIVGYLRDNANVPYIQQRVWIDLYHDSDEIDVEYTMVDTTARTNRDDFSLFTDVNFACQNLGLNLDHTISSNQKYIFGGETSNAIGDLSSEQYLLQGGNHVQNQYHLISTDPNFNDLRSEVTGTTGSYQEYSGVQEGSRAKGYSTIHNGTIGITTMFKQFWEKYPRELGLSSTQVKIGMFPDKYNEGTPTIRHSITNGLFTKPNTLYHTRNGMAQTYEFKLKFHVATPVETDIENILANYKENSPELLASADYYCSSGFLYNDLIPMDSNSSVYHQAILNNRLLFARTEHPGRYRVPGWRDYGDRLRTDEEIQSPQEVSAWYNGSHVGGINYAILYFMTMNMEWWDECVMETRLFQDLFVQHSELRNWAKDPAYEPYPPGDILCSDKHIDHDSRQGITSHYHVSGMVPYYFLTGNQRTKEVMEEIAGHRKWLVPHQYPYNPRPVTYLNHNRAYHEAEREVAWDLYTMLQHVKMSGDKAYFEDTCAHTINYMIEWWKQKTDHYIAGAIVGTIDWEQGTGWWNPDNMDNGIGGTFSNSTIPWMCGMLLHSLVEYHEMAEDFGSTVVDLVEFRQMLYQCTQFMFDWGYDSSSNIFYYSAARTGTSGGATMILSAVSWIYLKYNQDVVGGNITNPEWFNPTLWKQALLYWYGVWKTTPNSHIPYRHGFYGYELVFPGWFWKNMITIEAE